MVLEFLNHLWTYTETEKDALKSDGESSLMRKHSTTIETPAGTGSGQLRIVAVPNVEVEALDPPLPLVVFLHGLGGSLVQFEHIVDFFSYFASVVAIDLPGHGKSSYVADWDAYTTPNLVKLVEGLLESPELPRHSGYLFVGHSMGTALALKLAGALGPKCVGVACLAPPCVADLAKLARLQRYVPWIPPAFFNLFRTYDRVGGLNSTSVRRFVSPETLDDGVLKRQLRTNLRSETQAWLRAAAGHVPFTEAEAASVGCPVLVVTGADDKVTPPAQAQLLVDWLEAAQVPVTYREVKHAGHALMLERPEIVQGLLGEFAKHVNERLSLAWHLSHLATKSDKWSVKNEEKWRRTQAVGAVVEGTRLRGMKTLREEDDTHSPGAIENEFPDMVAIIDISREQPPYEASSFQNLTYHKFPTVSKVPPSQEEVANFIKLVDRIPVTDKQSIGVHCHYGFNRTGFLIVAYMIERQGRSVEDALAAFATSRPTGIHHLHFIDELHLRYNL